MSIRLKITLWFSLIVVILVGITLLIALNASRVVLRGTVRDYMISTVEENVGKIKLVQKCSIRLQRKYMILMQTRFYFTVPYTAATKFITVTAFCH